MVEDAEMMEAEMWMQLRECWMEGREERKKRGDGERFEDMWCR